MRFRANVDDVGNFYKIIQAIEKLQKKCVIKFTTTNMHIICNSDVNEGGIQVWSQIKVASLFTDYRIQSNANNEITLSISPEALLLALRSAANPPSLSSTPDVVMKLAKKNNQAVLSFEISGTMASGRRVMVGHDVRIDVLRPSDVKKLTEPMCPEPEVHILLPPLQKMRTIIERLRSLSDTIAVKANNNGRLQISVRTESVSVDTQWSGCINPKISSSDPKTQNTSDTEPDDDEGHDKTDPDLMFSVLISIKGFLKFLNSHVLSSTTIACICQQHCMILYVYIGDVADAGGVLTFYIPTFIDD